MIEVKFKEKIYNVRNLFSEITIAEYEAITKLFDNEKLNNISLWIEIFNILGWDEELIDNLDYNSFEEITTKFDFTSVNKDIIKTVYLDEVPYSCYDDEFKLKIRDLLKIEPLINTEDYLAKIAAILYNKDGFSKKENEDVNHFNYKVSMFKQQPAHIITPLLQEIGTGLSKKNSING